MDAPEPTPKEVHEILYGGADLTITHPDGRHETVKVRKLSRAEFSAYAVAVSDDSEMGELDELKLYVPDKPEEWWTALGDDARDRIQEEGSRLNFSCFARWWRRRLRMIHLAAGRSEELAAAQRLMAGEPTLSTPPGSRNGSPPAAIRVPLNGPGPLRNSG